MKYDCKENDNHIIYKPSEENETEGGEFWIGCDWAPAQGHSIIGEKDLFEMLDKAGFVITRKEDALMNP